MVTDKRGKWIVKVKGLPILVIKPQRELPDPAQLKTLTITRKPTGVYVSLGYEVEKGSASKDGEVCRPGYGCVLAYSILRRLFRRPPTTRKRQGDDTPEADLPGASVVLEVSASYTANLQDSGIGSLYETATSATE